MISAGQLGSMLLDVVEGDAPRLAAAAWKPYYRGPKDLRLRCMGSRLARALCALHFGWPFARGQQRFVRMLAAITRGSEALRDVPFQSPSGVPVFLDLPTYHFLHLSGRLPAEPLELSILSLMVRPGDVFVDVGAHWGLYIPHILGRIGGGDYWVIEPSLSNIAFMRRAFRSAKGLRYSPVAVSDWRGLAYLRHDGTPEAFITKDPPGMAIEVERLDRLLRSIDATRPLVIKIDSEGQDAAVIRGCGGLAASGAKPIFMVEYLPLVHGQIRAEIRSAIETEFGTDYRYFAIDQGAGRLVPFKGHDDVPEGVRNILAVPVGQLWRLRDSPFLGEAVASQ